MKLEPRHERPLHLLRLAEAAVPGCWAQLERYREERGRGWPSWCYLPVDAGFAVASQGADPSKILWGKLAPQSQRGVALAAPAVALATWRVTQGIWDFDPDLFAELWSTPLDGQLPTELLFRLPEWAPYLCLENVSYRPGIPARGIFVWLNWKGDDRPGELRCMLDIDGAHGLGDVPLLGMQLDGETVDGCLHNAFSAILERRGSLVGTQACTSMDADLLRHILSPVLYLCSQEPDLTRRLPPAPATLRRSALRPPSRPVVWPVGLRIGAALRAASSAARGEPGEPSGRAVRPHVRRAHWHCYWVGSRTEDRPGERVELRWIAPVTVGVGEPAAVVRPVR